MSKLSDLINAEDSFLVKLRCENTFDETKYLEINEHKGFLKKYTNLASAPRKTHSSDWNYPVDFWLGKDGINKDAFKFWFGEYKELLPLSN